MFPSFTFVQNDPDKLANYLCFLGKQIASGFYQDKRFLVLPRLIKKNSKTIFFPDLPYSKEFWKEVGKFGQNDDVFFFPKTVPLVLNALENDKFKTNWAGLSEWKEKEPEFTKILKDLLTDFDFSSINSVSVLVTPFGSVGSLFFEKKGKKYDFYLTVREDFGPVQVAETFLTQIVWLTNHSLKIENWFQVESVVDFLMSKTKLAHLFKENYVPTISKTPEISENLVLESENYLTHLGFPVKPSLTIKENNIFINGNKINNLFTPTEERILKALIENKGRILSYEKIGNLFWGEDASLEKFSLQSIAKIMEKIRAKIKDLGVNSEVVFTIKGKGYVLYN